MTTTDQLLVALIEASVHVPRQLTAGKHEQDRLDAEAWVTKWGGLVCWAREQPKQKPIRWDPPFGGRGGSQ